MVIRNAIYATDDDLGLSFENYLISHYDECVMDRRMPCAVCKRQCSSCFSYKGKLVDCHKECIGFLLFYLFLHFYEINLGSGEDEFPTPTLKKLYEMPFELPSSPSHKFRCSYCGTKTSYFKCASENCVNYYHVQCNANEMVIAYHTGIEGKKVSYRFLLCQTHMNSYEIDLVKCRFHSKVSLMSEYDLFKRVKESAKSKSSQTTIASSSSSDSAAPKTSKKSQANKKQSKNDRKVTYNRPSSNKKKYDEMPPNLLPDLKVERGTPLPSTTANDKSTHIKDYVACLMNEYGIQRRQIYQKNTKKFEWWPYDILFSKVGQELFGTHIPDNNVIAELYSDMRGLLNVDHDYINIDDIKRVPRESEPSIVSICNSIANQLNKELAAQPGLKGDDNVHQNLEGRDPLVLCSQAESYFSMFKDSVMKIDPHAVEKSFNTDLFHWVNFPNVRPSFAIVKLGNSAMWFSYAYLKPRRYNHDRLVILDYVHLNELEFAYLRRSIRFAYYIRKQNKVVPILSAGRYVPSLAKEEEEDLIKDPETGKERTSVTTGTFVWDLFPSMMDYIHDKLPSVYEPAELEDVDPNDEVTKDRAKLDKPFEDLNMDEKNPENSTFVSKQVHFFINLLNTVNGSIQVHKRKLKAKLKEEAQYIGRIHEDKEMVDQYSRVSARMNRWSHFRYAFQSAVDQFNFLLDFETQPTDEVARAEALKETADKEFCSVCLMSEQAYKQLLHQCSRCFMRVHYKCYMSYKPSTSQAVGGKEDDKFAQWYCDPCEYDTLMSGEHVEHTYNTAVCCVCCSSGGALKKVYETSTKRPHSSSQVKWVHVVCAALLMPKVTCKDWVELSKWDLSAIKFNNTTPCNICKQIGGFLVHCPVGGCTEIYHITCAWVSGSYIEEDCVHNSCDFRMPSISIYTDLFPMVSFKLLCLQHTMKRFSEHALQAVAKRKCHAYTHYLYHPASSLKTSKDPRLTNLPLRSYASPVTITKDGPVKTIISREAVQPRQRLHNSQLGSLPDVPQIKRGKAVARQVPNTPQVMPQPSPQTMPQQVMVQHAPQNMVMVNNTHMMMNSAPQMILAGGQPMYLNGAPAIMSNTVPTMVMNGAPQYMMNGAHPYMISSHQPRMMMMTAASAMSTPRGIVPKDMYPGMMGQVVYGDQRTYMNGTPRYGVSAIVSSMSNSGYMQQMPQHTMAPMEYPMQQVMTTYDGRMAATPMGGAMLQHPQYQTGGYMQPVQIVSKYWDPRMNQMQYPENQIPRDNPYYGIGGGGASGGMG